MNKNVGTIDKLVRIVLALIATYFAYSKEFDPSWINYVLWAVAIILLITALISRCPIFSLLGISSCKVKN